MSDCPHLITLRVERRPGNALNVEIGTPAPRCTLKPPEDWEARGGSVLRWLGSGGSPLVLGNCSSDCPLKLPPCPKCGAFAGDPCLSQSAASLKAQREGLGLMQYFCKHPHAERKVT